ncbi:TfoX/Sxy family protein [Microvirga roseola]|uniref:TfoX/Sxy family protein n=1 Tax=Microvirga roseola TaxID=2883126 RepID=UPI001E5EF809|nr:TfoX/Sxy family protein [Microvirga roseola]
MDAEAIRDVLRNLGPVHIRRMFGGQGVYQGELMFALEAYGELYLKVDDESIGLFRERGSRPFVYESRDGRTTTISYWLIPESALDDPDEAAELAGLALAAARRAKAPKARRTGKTTPRRKAREPESLT